MSGIEIPIDQSRLQKLNRGHTVYVRLGDHDAYDGIYLEPRSQSDAEKEMQRRGKQDE